MVVAGVPALAAVHALAGHELEAVGTTASLCVDRVAVAAAARGAHLVHHGVNILGVELVAGVHLEVVEGDRTTGHMSRDGDRACTGAATADLVAPVLVAAILILALPLVQRVITQVAPASRVVLGVVAREPLTLAVVVARSVVGADVDGANVARDISAQVDGWVPLRDLVALLRVGARVHDGAHRLVAARQLDLKNIRASPEGKFYILRRPRNVEHSAVGRVRGAFVAVCVAISDTSERRRASL